MSVVPNLNSAVSFLVPLLKIFAVLVVVVVALGLVVVRVVAGRLRERAFGPGGGLKP